MIFMKKITLLLITILLPFSMMSQGWTEGFEDLTVDGFGSVVWPEGWVALNGPSDAGTQQWTSSDDAASGAQAAYIQYELLGAGASQDFLITPQFTPSAEQASIFSFKHKKTYGTVYPTDYSVKITSGAQSDFESYVDLIAFGAADLTTDYEVLALDIPVEYYGIPVHVAFVHENNDGDDWYIDDVFVFGSGTHDLAVDVSSASEYTLMPANHISPIATTVDVSNLGAVSDNGAAVLLEVTNENGDVVYSETQSFDSAAQESTSISFSGYSPNMPGVYYVNATVYAGGDVPDDLDPSNNSASTSLTITNGTFGRDNATPADPAISSLGIGNPTDIGYLGSSFTLNSPDNLTSVSFGISNALQGIEGSQVRAAIFETTVTGAPQFTPVAYTEYVTVSGVRNVYTAQIEGGSVLVDGTFVAAVEENPANLPADSNVQVSTTTDIFTPGAAWVWWESIPNDLGAWQNAEEFGFNIAYVIRPNFNDNVFSTEEVISFEMSHSYDFESKILTINSQEMLKRVNIYNMLGQEVMSNDVEGVNVNMNLSELNSSIYIVNVEGMNNTSNTFKIIVK